MNERTRFITHDLAELNALTGCDLALSSYDPGDGRRYGITYKGGGRFVNGNSHAMRSLREVELVTTAMLFAANAARAKENTDETL